MAVEIKEIVVRAVLTDNNKEIDNHSAIDLDREHLIQECVNQVMKILEKKKRR